MATNNALNVQGPTPLFSVYNSSDLLLTAGGGGGIAFDTVLYDTTSSFGGTAYVIPSSGYYLFNCNFTLNVVVSGYVSLSLDPEDGNRRYFTPVNVPVTAGNTYFFSGSFVVYKNEGGLVYAIFNTSAGSEIYAVATREKTSFSGSLLFAV